MFTLEQLAEILAKEFGAPFLEEGFVFSGIHVDEEGNKSLHLRIGPRDVQIDEEGTVLCATGTLLGEPVAEGDTFGDFLEEDSALEIEADKLYDEALEEHEEFWTEAYEKYPDSNRNQAQEATDYILAKFEEAYKEFYPNEETWEMVKQFLNSKVHSGLT